jgi:hypothetical protein
MVKNREIAENWMRGVGAKKSGSMFWEGKAIYSYGYHFPIAVKIGFSKVLVNSSSYSNTTSKHQHDVGFAIPLAWKRVYAPTEVLKNYLHDPSEPIIIEKDREVSGMGEVLDIMKTFVKSRGVKRFPRKEIQDYLTQKFVARMI